MGDSQSETIYYAGPAPSSQQGDNHSRFFRPRSNSVEPTLPSSFIYKRASYWTFNSALKTTIPFLLLGFVYAWDDCQNNFTSTSPQFIAIQFAFFAGLVVLSRYVLKAITGIGDNYFESNTHEKGNEFNKKHREMKDGALKRYKDQFILENDSLLKKSWFEALLLGSLVGLPFIRANISSYGNINFIIPQTIAVFMIAYLLARHAPNGLDQKNKTGEHSKYARENQTNEPKLRETYTLRTLQYAIPLITLTALPFFYHNLAPHNNPLFTSLSFAAYGFALSFVLPNILTFIARKMDTYCARRYITAVFD